MELIASLFCHVSESIPEAEIQRELQRQHDILAQNAASSGRTIEHLSLIQISEPTRPY